MGFLKRFFGSNEQTKPRQPLEPHLEVRSNGHHSQNSDQSELSYSERMDALSKKDDEDLFDDRVREDEWELYQPQVYARANGLGENGFGENGFGENGLGENGFGENGLGGSGLGGSGLGESGSLFQKGGLIDPIHDVGSLEPPMIPSTNAKTHLERPQSVRRQRMLQTGRGEGERVDEVILSNEGSALSPSEDSFADYLDDWALGDSSEQDHFEARGQKRADRSLGLPETEIIAEIAPPVMLEGHGASEVFFDRWGIQSDIMGDEAKVFQWATEEDALTQSERVSFALLPVVVPSPLSACSSERAAIDQLREMPSSETRDKELVLRYQRYLTLVPNDMDMWSELSEFLIETQGIEIASDHLRAALGTARDDTALLLQLTEMARRVCDYIIAARYIEHAVQLQPHNIEVLTLLRDVQLDNKLTGPAQDTEDLIQSLLKHQSHSRLHNIAEESGEFE